MSKIAVWCRHKDDNVIGIGANIPWHVSSDFKRFRRITQKQNLVAGETTYETFPNRTLPNRKIYVLTLNKDYQVSDVNNHFVINDITYFNNFTSNLFIVGGATIYKLFMTTDEKLLPDIIVDSEYLGDLPTNLEGKHIDISPCVEIMNEKYQQFSKDYLLDNIRTRVFVKKETEIDLDEFNRIVNAIESE